MNVELRSAPVAEARPDPIALARALHARFGIQAPHELTLELIAWHCGARVVYRDTGSADARVVRAGDHAILAIALHARGTPRARFSIAHELGHHLMHADYDAIARIHGLPRTTDREFAVEREANTFASEFLVSRSLAEPLCRDTLPTLDALLSFAGTFDVSLTVAAKRWAQLARTPCAFVESRGGIIRRAVRSAAFRGTAFERRKLEEGTLALDMHRTGGLASSRMHVAAWGSPADSPILEHSLPLADGAPGGPVLTWLTHA